MKNILFAFVVLVATVRGEASVTGQIGRMQVDAREGKHAETHFRILQTGSRTSLLEAQPVTGRTHQIRIHLLAGGHRLGFVVNRDRGAVPALLAAGGYEAASPAEARS